MHQEFEGDISLVEELAEQDLHDAAQHGGTITPGQLIPIYLRVSAHYGGNGGFGLFCTLSKECQPNCN
ncbi:plantaricin C family lantibiotic [Streptomyces sp. NPDC059679]|uniref:plantaricin C family lantibiotic n=1 Tax=Streptomyces sp. NPDC059679 TaxID=3346903 RepID=UPI003677F954